jgi:hypothetical protein
LLNRIDNTTKLDTLYASKEKSTMSMSAVVHCRLEVSVNVKSLQRCSLSRKEDLTTKRHSIIDVSFSRIKNEKAQRSMLIIVDLTCFR